MKKRYTHIVGKSCSNENSASANKVISAAGLFPFKGLNEIIINEKDTVTSDDACKPKSGQRAMRDFVQYRIYQLPTDTSGGQIVFELSGSASYLCCDQHHSSIDRKKEIP